MSVSSSGVDSVDGASLLSSPVRREIVDCLSGRTGLTAADLADHLGLHVTTVRFHLDQLIAGGLVTTTSESRGVGRPRKVYAAAAGSWELTQDPGEAWRVLTGLLAETFGEQHPDGTPISPEEAGRRWALANVPDDGQPQAGSAGTWLGKVGQMIDTLRVWGYTPSITTTDHGRTVCVELHRCPFLELARTNPAVACGIHRGLISGAMTRLGEPETKVSLQPFVKPELCLAHVTTTANFTSPRKDDR